MIIKKLVSTMDGEYIMDPLCSDDNVYYLNQGVEYNPIDKRWFNINSLGLSKSRNYALGLLKKDEIGIISDNDVLMVANYKKIIKNAFKIFPDADVITFKAYNHDFTSLKKYSNKEFRHSKLSIMRVSSIEIVVKNNNIPSFDEKFGLGASIPIGEENIFLSDCIDSGLNVYFIPEFICIHNDITHSGLNFNSVINGYRIKVFKRIYGCFLGGLIYLAFIFKNRNRLSDGLLKNIFI